MDVTGNPHLECDDAKRSEMIEFLLNLESENEDPPGYGFKRFRGLFEVSFKTDKFKDWWNTGDEIIQKNIVNAIYEKYGNKFYKNYLEECHSHLTEGKNDDIKHYLLYREQRGRPLPKATYYDDHRSFFEIPFATEEYRKWWSIEWSAGPSFQSTLDYIDLEDDNDEFCPFSCPTTLPIGEREKSKKRDDAFQLKKKYIKAKYYLLERESKNRKPPKWRYNEYRGKFDIPFETEVYKQWWTSEAEPTDDANDSECAIEYSDEYLNPAKKDFYQQKWATRYLLSREAANESPDNGSNLQYEHGTFDIPFQSMEYRKWWSNHCENDFGVSYYDNIEITKRSLTQRLLGYESLQMDPPKKYPNDDLHGTFIIPFESDKFRDWWDAPIDLTNVDSNCWFSFLLRNACDNIVECFNGNSIRLHKFECDYRFWLTNYLLDLEKQNKNLPNSTFSGERGRFEISFKTERFQIWWNEKNAQH